MRARGAENSGKARRGDAAGFAANGADNMQPAAPPQPLTMDRSGMERPPPSSGFSCFGCCAGDAPARATRYKGRNERVFYDSARAKRSFAGRLHYCIACPGWSKATSERVVYSRWNLVPLCKLPSVMAGQCCGCCCCSREEADWLPPPDPTCIKTASTPSDGDGCFSWRLPCGRMLDTFDADIVVDASAHQTLLQICRGEGDVVLYRKAGADLSDPDELFVMTDVVQPFEVFSHITFELAKIDLQGATTQALGARMGATVWNYDARSGTDSAGGQQAFKSGGWKGEQEHVFFDSAPAAVEKERPRCCGGRRLL